MSYYTDDYYENTQQQQQSQSLSQAPEDTFVCGTCGATTSYMDDTTGYLCCTQCYTQSQNIVMTDDALDLNDVQALAATAGYGRYHMAKRAGQGDGRSRARGKLPLEPLDKSKPLPNLITCLHGIQRILQESILCLATILDLDDKQIHTIQQTIHTLWKSYLKSWKDGADYYGKLHPEVRFSLRDSFITKEHRKMLMRSLVYRAEESTRKKEKEEQDEEEQENTGEKKGDEKQYSTQLKFQKQKRSNLKRPPLKIDDDSSTSTDSSSDSDSDSSSSSDNDSSSSGSDAEGETNQAASDINGGEGTDVERSKTPSQQEQNSTMKHYNYQKQYSKIDTILRIYHNNYTRKGRREAALRLKPNMQFCIAMIWIGAGTPLGITIHDMVQWIANGSLPLLNAFDTMLSDSERESLKPLAHVYRLSRVPKASTIKVQAKLIVTACKLKSLNYLDSLLQPSSSNGDDESKSRSGGAVAAAKAQHHQSQHEESNTRIKESPPSSREEETKEEVKTANKRNPRTQILFLPSRSVPLLLARYVRELGFGQHILNTCYALAGILEDQGNVDTLRKDTWLPTALESAHPTKLKTPAHVLAVIVVACKMCAGWEDWAFCQRQWTFDQKKSNNKDSIKESSSPSHNEETKRIRKRRRLLNSPGKFVPWNEQQFRLLKNGPMLHGYLDFLEDIYATDKDDTLQRFQDFLLSLDATTGADEDEVIVRHGEEIDTTPTAKKENVVCWNNVIAGGRNPNRPKLWKRKKRQDWYLHLRKKAAEWSDANGLGRYVIYENRRSHARMDELGEKRMDAVQEAALTPEPFHPHYGNFLECLAYTAGADPSEIHAVVAKLDEEVLGTAKAKPATLQRIYKKKRLRPKEELLQEKAYSDDEGKISNVENVEGELSVGDNVEEEEFLGRKAFESLDPGSEDVTSKTSESAEELKIAMVGLLMSQSEHIPATKYV